MRVSRYRSEQSHRPRLARLRLLDVPELRRVCEARYWSFGSVSPGMSHTSFRLLWGLFSPQLRRNLLGPAMDLASIAVIALTRMRAAHGGLLQMTELAQVEVAGEELWLARIRRLDQPLDKPGSQRVRVVRDRRLSDHRARVLTAVQPSAVLITGETPGIGYETAQVLAKRGAQLLITGRDAKRGERAAAAIRCESGNEDVRLLQGDHP